MAKKTDSSAASARFTDTKRVKDLVALMAENGLTEIELVEDKSRIVLRRGTSTAAPAAGQYVQAGPVQHAPAPAAPTAPAGPLAPKAADEGLIPIKAPMVGTFYSASSPDSDPFVSIGTEVSEKSVVCIVEAMKHFNEISAEVRGTVTKILVSNGQIVEFGQPLFLVKPA